MRRSIRQYNGYAVEVIYSIVGTTLRIIEGYYLDTGLAMDADELRDLERRERRYGQD